MVSRIKTCYSEVVSDLQAVKAVKNFLDDHRILVEPACAASLAVIYEQFDLVMDDKGALVVEVCGGSGIDMKQLRVYEERVGL